MSDNEPTRPENPFTPKAEDYLTAAVSTLVRQRPLTAWQVLVLSAIGATIPVAILGAVAYHYADAVRHDLSEETEDLYYLAQEAKWTARDAASDAEAVLEALARDASVPGDDPGGEQSLAGVMPPIVMTEIRRLGLLDRVRYAEYAGTLWIFAPREGLADLDIDVRGMLDQAAHEHQVRLVEEWR